MKRPGFVSPLSLMASALVVLIVVGVTWLAGGVLFSPGPLSAQARYRQTLNSVTSHAALSGDCRACHPAPWEHDRMADRCMACHADVAAEFAARSGVHALVSAGDDCRECHPEHRGAGGSLTAFRVDAEVHGRTGFSLVQHTQQPDGSGFDCADCHPTGYGPFDQVICVDCHAASDAPFMAQHQADYGGDCLACHNGLTRLATFNHGWTRLPLEGKHVLLECRLCHAGRTQLTGLPVACAGCHADRDPHQGRLGRECGTCHTPAGWTPTTFDHAHTRFPLAGKHAAIPCLDCHADQTFSAAGSACYTCHAQDDAHDGKLGTDCGRCHQATAWTDASFDHGETAFPLAGSHASVPCLNCHDEQTFAVPGSTCSSCHAADDAHQGKFGSDCGACHQPTAWAEATLDHGKTGFPLTGAHAAVACANCHRSDTFAAIGSTCSACHAADDAHQGKFGSDCGACHQPTAWADATFDHGKTDFPLTGAHVAVACANCHRSDTFAAIGSTCSACHAADDLHRGQLGTDCGRCHRATAWADVSFDHAATRFPLTGKHAEVPCLECHADRTFSTSGSACYTCHAADDAHQGGFGTDCGACHRTMSWSDVSFDHSKTAFPLTGGHAGVACMSCHTAPTFAVPGSTCRACHAADDAHQGRFGTDCGACHKPTTWTDVTFDHGKTAFPLSGAHSGLACTRCHAGATFAVPGSSCRACHATDDAHNGAFGTDCGACHKPTIWMDVTFDHSKTAFPLTGGHSGVACDRCHASGTFAVRGSTCQACHAADDPHNGTFGTDCGACHKPTTWTDVSFDHSKTAFPLAGGHSGLACTRCHAGGTFAVPGTTCVACHAADDAHNGAFGTDCGACHKPTTWTDVSFDHSKTAFPLTGQHQGLQCTRCHPGGVFQGTSTTCSACHTAPATHVGALFSGGSCSGCHTTSGWTPANLPNHTFPLNHGRTTSACAVCHPSTYASYTCYGCHEHSQAEMIATHQERGITDLSDCAHCHPTGRGDGGD